MSGASPPSVAGASAAPVQGRSDLVSGSTSRSQEPAIDPLRDQLTPPRLAFVSWDHTFLLRRGQGTSFDQPAQALDEVVDRGYNAIRLDPLPQWVDIDRPDEVLSWPDPHSPYILWCLNSAISGPVGRWLLDYVEALHSRPLNYTLSAWWFGHDGIGPAARLPANHLDAAEIWADALHRWASRFDLDRILYVDLANEVPYFIPALTSRLAQRMGADWHASSRWSAEQIDVLVEEMNPAISALQREFPQLRFTYSIHGDPRWLDVPLNVDCLDVHFFADIDSRWADRVQFSETMPALIPAETGCRSSDDAASRHGARWVRCSGPGNAP